MNVVLVGASNKSDRYASMAFHLLREKGHVVFPVHPTLSDISGVRVFPSLREIPDPVHTVTMYVNKARSDQMIPAILALKPTRIIFNPGAENDDLEKAARRAGIEVVEACTLVMLRTGQF